MKREDRKGSMISYIRIFDTYFSKKNAFVMKNGSSRADLEVLLGG